MTAHSDPHPPLSRRLHDLAAGDAPAVTLGELADAAGAAGVGMLLLLLTAGAMIPGIAPAFGAALCVASLPLIAGRQSLLLPSWLRRRGFPRAAYRARVARLVPLLRRLDVWLRPRLSGCRGGVVLRLVGIASLLNGVLILLPIPFGNTAPAASSLAIAAGLAAHDGLFVLLGLAAAAIALLIDVVLIALFWAALVGLAGAFG